MKLPLRVRRLICKHRGCQPLTKYTKQGTGVIVVAWVCLRCEQGHAETKLGQFPQRRIV